MFILDVFYLFIHIILFSYAYLFFVNSISSGIGSLRTKGLRAPKVKH